MLILGITLNRETLTCVWNFRFEVAGCHLTIQNNSWSVVDELFEDEQ